MSMDLRHLLAMLLVTTPSTVVLTVWSGVGGYLFPITYRVWRSVIASRLLMKRDPRSASAGEDMISLMICEMVMTAPLFWGMAESLDMK